MTCLEPYLNMTCLESSEIFLFPGDSRHDL